MQAARANSCLERKQSEGLRSKSMSRVLLAAFAIAVASRAVGQAAPHGNPSLTSYSPTQGTQGTTVTLTFTGANFTPRQLKLLFEDGLLTEDFYARKVAECEAAQ